MRVFALLMLMAVPVAAQELEAVAIRPVQKLNEPFTRVRGIRELSDGRVLVADQRENAVYMTDFRNQSRTRIGSNGAGPAEYDVPIGLFAGRADSTYLNDFSNSRLAILAPDGRIVRTQLFAGWIRRFDAIDSLGNVYWDEVSNLRLAKMDNPATGDDAPIVRLSVKDVVDTLSAVTVPDANPTPFNAWDSWTVGPDGRVVVVRNRKPFRIDIVEPGGRVVKGPETPYEVLRVTSADRQAYTADNKAGGGVGAGRMGGSSGRSNIKFPDQFPPAVTDRVWVAADGNTWVQRHQHLDADGLVYDVFDRTGRRVARYRLPAGSQVVGFGRRGMYALHIDEVDLQWLERYDVSTTPASK